VDGRQRHGENTGQFEENGRGVNEKYESLNYKGGGRSGGVKQ
jgi:hypothetical protein